MTYRYAAEIALLENCPPAGVIPCDTETYRFVHDEITDERNFKCVAKLNPRRVLKPEKRCAAWALSLFESREKAAKFYQRLKSGNPNVGKSLGNKLAVGIIEPEDGHMSKPDEKGHFDLWEAEGANIGARFRIVGDLDLDLCA